MEEAPRVREALYEALQEVDPAPFRARLERTLEGRPLTPGVLTVRTARAADPTLAPEAAAERAVGVQLTYEGLRLTRHLIETEPWSPASEGDAAGRSAPGEPPVASAPGDPDVDVVAAEVLVARGLKGLAPTGVRGRVVDIVRTFGRTHTRDAGPAAEAAADDPGRERAAGEPAFADDPDAGSLEADFVVLAVAAGADLATPTVPPGLVEYARDLAAEIDTDPLPGADAIDGVAADVERIVAAAEPAAEDRSRSSTMDP